MNEPDDRPDDAAAPHAPAPAGETSERADDLERIERGVSEIRAHFQAEKREARHKDFSLALLAAVIAQALAVVLLAWAALDCLQRFDASVILVKLAFAGVLQLIALTGFASYRSVG